MKFRIFLVVIFICIGLSAIVCAQSDSQSLIIRHVVLETDPNPRFIRSIAEAGIPWSRVTTKNDVDCIKKRLMNTGLFKRIDSRFHQPKEVGVYDLVLTIEFESEKPVYTLSKVEVLGVKGVDNVTLTNLLSSEGLVGQAVSLQTADYATFEDGLYELLRKSIADEEDKEWRKEPWLDLKLDSNKELEIIVLPEYTPCPGASP